MKTDLLYMQPFVTMTKTTGPKTLDSVEFTLKKIGSYRGFEEIAHGRALNVLNTV